MTSSSTQRIGPIRSTIRSFLEDKRAKAKRPHILPRPNRRQPPPPDAEIVEISSDDEGPAAAPHETIDLTMDDGDGERVLPAFLSTPVVSPGHTALTLFSLHHF